MNEQIFGPLYRKKFILFLLKILAFSGLALQAESCNPPEDSPPVALLGLEGGQRHAFNTVTQVFLQETPFAAFDGGLALDRYLFAGPEILPVAPLVKQLLSVLSSRLAAVFLDFSFTPLASLPLAKREQRLLAWKNSSLSLKRAAYAALRQVCFLLVSAEPAYQLALGYEPGYSTASAGAKRGAHGF